MRHEPDQLLHDFWFVEALPDLGESFSILLDNLFEFAHLRGDVPHQILTQIFHACKMREIALIKEHRNKSEVSQLFMMILLLMPP